MSHKVDVIGPISGADRERTGHGEDYHVHAADCGDCSRYGGEHWIATAASRVHVADLVFADIADENGEDASAYLSQFWFAPCLAKLPVTDTPAVEAPEHPDPPERVNLADVMRAAIDAAGTRLGDVRGAHVEPAGPGTLPGGVVQFVRGDAHGTARFNYRADTQEVDFFWGHYDLAPGAGRDDFAARVKSGT